MLDEPLLYEVSDSPFCIKARMCLQLKGVSYRRITVTPALAGTLRSLNPKRQVPVLVAGGDVVPDSSAIVRWLETRHPTPSLLPRDPAAQAYVALVEDWADEALYWTIAACKWRTPANRAVVERTVDEIRGRWPRTVAFHALRWSVTRRLAALRLDPRRTPDPTVRLRESLAILAGLLEGRDFLVGRAPTLADLAAFAQVAWLRPYAEWPLVRELPPVAAWVDRLLDVPAIADALPSEEPPPA